MSLGCSHTVERATAAGDTHKTGVPWSIFALPKAARMARYQSVQPRPADWTLFCQTLASVVSNRQQQCHWITVLFFCNDIPAVTFVSFYLDRFMHVNELRIVICVCFKVVFPLIFQLCSKRHGVLHLFVRPIMEQMGYSMSCSGLLSEPSVFCSLGSGRMCCFSSGAWQWAIFVVARSKNFSGELQMAAGVRGKYFHPPLSPAVRVVVSPVGWKVGAGLGKIHSI